MNRNFMLISAMASALALIALVLAGYMYGQQRSLLNRLATVESQVAAVEEVQADRQALDGVPREDFDQLADQVGALVQQVAQLEAELGEAPDMPEPGGAENGAPEQDEDATADNAAANGETDTEAPAE